MVVANSLCPAQRFRADIGLRVAGSTEPTLRRTRRNCRRLTKLLSSAVGQQLVFQPAEYDRVKAAIDGFIAAFKDSQAESMTQESKSQLKCRRERAVADANRYNEYRERLLPMATIFVQCELEPASRRLQETSDIAKQLKLRIDYLAFWMSGGSTAPALEVLLYIFLPIADLLPICGDLHDEYFSS